MSDTEQSMSDTEKSTSHTNTGQTPVSNLLTKKKSGKKSTAKKSTQDVVVVPHTLEEIKDLPRKMYNKNEAPEEEVSKQCLWCAETKMIPSNYKLCTECNFAMLAAKRVQDAARAREERAKKTVTHKCLHCNETELTGNKKFCDKEDCQEAKTTHKMEIDKARKQEKYEVQKKMLRSKEVTDRTVSILNAYAQNDVEAFKKFSDTDKTSALLAYVASLSPEEYDALLVDLLQESDA